MWFRDLISNQFLLTGISSWLWAQVLKTIIHALVTHRLDLSRLVGDGGMPSGHSATVSSFAVAAAFVYGLDSFEFAIAAVLAVIVCKDAMGVRLETGKQAAIINEIVRAFDELSSGKLTDVKLKEFVAHSGAGRNFARHCERGAAAPLYLPVKTLRRNSIRHHGP